MNKKINVYLMCIIILLQGFVFYGPVATLYRQSRSLSLSEMFLIESISWILMIAFEIPWGIFADKFGYKKTLIIANFIYFISKIVFYEADSFVMFFLERVLLSLSLAGISGCDVALIYSSIKEEESQKVFGIYNAFSTGGYLIASVVSSILIKQSLDSTAFWTIIPYGIAAVLTLFIKDAEVKHEEKPNIKQSLLMVLKKKDIIILVISSALMGEVFQTAIIFLNQAQYLRSGIDIKYFGILAAVMQIAGLSSLKAHKLSEKAGQYRSLKILYIMITISCIMLVFTANAELTIFSMIMICASVAAVSPIVLDIENKSITTADRATILSLFSLFGDLTSSGTNIVIGKIADFSVEVSFMACTIMCVCAYIMIMIYKRNNKEVN